MDLQQAMALFGYTQLPSADQVRKDFAAKLNALQQAKAAASDATRKQVLQTQISELVKARDSLINAIGRQGTGPSSTPAPPPGATPPPSGVPRPTAAPSSSPPPPAPPQPTPSWRSWMGGPRLWPPVPPVVARMPIRRILGWGVAALFLIGCITAFMTRSGSEPDYPTAAGQAPAPNPPAHLQVMPYPWARVVLERDGAVVAQWDAPHRNIMPFQAGAYRVILHYADGRQADYRINLGPGDRYRVIVNRDTGHAWIEELPNVGDEL